MLKNIPIKYVKNITNSFPKLTKLISIAALASFVKEINCKLNKSPYISNIVIFK